MFKTILTDVSGSNTAWIVAAWSVAQAVIAANPDLTAKYPAANLWITGAILGIAAVVKLAEIIRGAKQKQNANATRNLRRAETKNKTKGQR